MSGLSGTVTSDSRAGLIAEAKKVAEGYFATPCVLVKLANERAEETFTADFEAGIWHSVESKTYGPGKCRGCGRDDWPQHPLNDLKEWS